MKLLSIILCLVAVSAFAEPRIYPHAAIPGTVNASNWTAAANAVTDIAVTEVKGVKAGDVVSVQQNSLGVVIIGRVSAADQVTISVSNPRNEAVEFINRGIQIHFYVVRFPWPDPK